MPKQMIRRNVSRDPKRAVNAHKLCVVQVSLKLQQCPTHNVREITHMQAGVVAHSFNPVDVRDVQEQHLASAFDDEALGSLHSLRCVVCKLILGTLQCTVKCFGF